MTQPGDFPTAPADEPVYQPPNMPERLPGDPHPPMADPPTNPDLPGMPPPDPSPNRDTPLIPDPMPSPMPI